MRTRLEKCARRTDGCGIDVELFTKQTQKKIVRKDRKEEEAGAAKTTAETITIIIN